MGFKHWFEGLEVVGLFLIVVALPCFFIGLWGSKMINDLGNFPTKSAKIQVSVWWIYLVEFFFLLLVVAYGAFLCNSNVKG